MDAEVHPRIVSALEALRLVRTGPRSSALYLVSYAGVDRCKSIRFQVHNGLQNVLRLRQNRVFQLRLVGDKGVHRADAPHRRVKIVEQLIGDARGNLRAVAPAQHVFVRHDHAIGLAH